MSIQRRPLHSFFHDYSIFSRRKAALVNFLTVAILSFPCLLGYNLWKNIHPFGGSSTILDFEDWLLSDLCLPLGSLTIVIFCCWNIGWKWKDYLAEVNTGTGMKLPAWLRYYAAYVLPLLVLYLFCAGIYERFFRT